MPVSVSQPESFEALAISDLADAAVAGSPEAWEALVALLLEDPDRPDLHEMATLAVGDRALTLLRRLLSATNREVRDVSPLLRRAGEAVGCLPIPDDWLETIREVTNRECCERNSFLAAALSGMARGMTMAGHGPTIEPEAVWRLAELADHPDPVLSQAAMEAQPHFLVLPEER